MFIQCICMCKAILPDSNIYKRLQNIQNMVAKLESLSEVVLACVSIQKAQKVVIFISLQVPLPPLSGYGLSVVSAVVIQGHVLQTTYKRRWAINSTRIPTFKVSNHKRFRLQTLTIQTEPNRKLFKTNTHQETTSAHSSVCPLMIFPSKQFGTISTKHLVNKNNRYLFWHYKYHSALDAGKYRLYFR